MINYLVGSRENFFDFISKITPEDKIQILTHVDLDGIASAIFLGEILKSKNLKVDYIDFINYKPNLFEGVSRLLRSREVTKVFLLDLGLEMHDNFLSFSSEFDLFLIDHHPIPLNFDYGILKNKVIKTASSDCNALVVYNLGEDIIDDKEWAWLVCAAMFSDFAYVKEENLKFIKNFYAGVDKENISTSVPGMNSRKIGSALIYYSNEIKKVYNLVKKKDLESLNEINDIIEEQINFHVDNFISKAEFFPEKKLYWYEMDSKFSLGSPVTSIVSKLKPGFSFITISKDSDGFVKVSARNHLADEDMGTLLKKGISGISDAVAGGHKPAAGGRLRERDLTKFKENILEN